MKTKFILLNPEEDHVYIWESKSRYQDTIIYNPKMLQSLSILSRYKNKDLTKIEVENLELIAHLAESGAGFAILPEQVVKSQKSLLKKVENTPTFKDELNLVCYPEILKSPEGKLVFDCLKKSYSL